MRNHGDFTGLTSGGGKKCLGSGYILKVDTAEFLLGWMSSWKERIFIN